MSEFQRRITTKLIATAFGVVLTLLAPRMLRGRRCSKSDR